MARLRQLDEDRAEIVRRLEQLAGRREHEAPAAGARPARRSSVSLKGARVRWVGA